MKTVGEILKKARLENKITLDDAEKSLKIRKKFLSALEDNDWSKLPSSPYIKGFLGNYSVLLGLRPEEMIAIFRRQYPNSLKKSEVVPKGLSHPLNEPFIQLTSQNFIIGIIFLFLILFFGYLGLQYKAFTSPPDLIVSEPQEGEIFKVNTIEITGKTDSDVVLSINEEKVVVNKDGNFKTNMTLLPGVNTITIESTSKHGKKKTIVRTIQFQEINN